METNTNYSTEKKSLFKPFITVLSLLFFINLAIINYILFTQKPQQQTTITPTPTVTQVPSASSLPPICDETCVKNIVKQATASITLATPKTIVQQQRPTTQPVEQARSREIFIALGTGQTAGGDWSDIPNTEKTIAPSQYANVKAIYFEATLSVPKSEGIAYARLYNATDSKPVVGSDVSTPLESPTLLTSQALTLEGTKVYRVQVKQSQQNDAVLTHSRIKLLLN